MKLKVFGSGSKGNCYLLYNETEALMLEAGVDFRKVTRYLGGKIRKINGCLVTHEHGDHAKYVKDVLNCGIPVYMTPGTYEYVMEHHRKVHTWAMRPKRFEVGQIFGIGGFTIIPFNTVHDAAEPCGFYINHPEMGNLLFATDTSYIPNTFADISNVMIECNYDEALLAAREDIPDSLKDRIRQSHQSLTTCIEALKANDLSKVNNIVLIHISEGDGDPVRFGREVSNNLGIGAYIANQDLDIEFNKTPF